MEDININTYVQFLNLLNHHDAFLFRGVSDVNNHLLIPSVGRNWIAELDELVKLENELLDDLKSRAAIHLDYQPRTNLEWLIIGQHYGIPTRL